MKFKENAKTALFKVLSDLIQSDGIVNQGEVDYLKHVAHLVGITKSSMKRSESLSLSEATAILRNLGNTEKTAILRIIQQLSVSDDCLDPDESLLITALLLSIRIRLPETDDINATLVSIPNLAFDTQNAVLYVEPDYDEKINVLIAKEHGTICKLLEKKERSFFFLPEVVRDMEHKKGTFSDIIRYIEPSLSEEQISVINDRFKQFSRVAADFEDE